MSPEEAIKRKRQLRRERMQQQRRNRMDRLRGQAHDVSVPQKSPQVVPKEKVRRDAGEGSHNNDEFEHMWISRRSKYQALCASATDASAWHAALIRAAAVNKNRQSERLQIEKGAIDRARAIAAERTRARVQDQKTKNRQRTALEALKQGGHRKLPSSTKRETKASAQALAVSDEGPNAQEVEVAARAAKARHLYEQQKADEAAQAKERHDAKLRLVHKVGMETAQALEGELTALMALEGIDAQEMLAAKAQAQSRERVTEMVNSDTKKRVAVAKESMGHSSGHELEPLSDKIATVAQSERQEIRGEDSDAPHQSLQRYITKVLGNTATTMGKELAHANKLKRDHEHRGEQLQFALAAARATTTKLPAIGASDGSRIDKCEPTYSN